MATQFSSYLFLYITEAKVILVEHNNCSLAITPCQIAKQLLDSRLEQSWAVPDFALTHKCRSVIELNTNVGLSDITERFPRRHT